MQQGFLSLGPLTLHFYGLFIAFGFLFLFYYSHRNCESFSIKHLDVDRAFLVILFSSLFGARLYHVFSWFNYYKMFPIEIFYIWQGGMGIFGAIAGSIIGLLVYSKINKINLFNILSLFGPPLLITQAIGRIGNYFNHEGFGPPTSLPWGIYILVYDRPIQFIEQNFYHPTFFYEALLCLLAFIIFIVIKKRLNHRMYFPFYLISYGLIRLVTESFRFDTWAIFNFKVAHVLSGAMILFGFFLLVKERIKFS